MTTIYTIINQKGGVGKSTTAMMLGAGLHQLGMRILFIDMDAQGNLSYALGTENPNISTMDLLTGAASINQTMVSTQSGELIPSSIALATADMVLTGTGREYLLKNILKPIRKQFDAIIIDTPPALGILSINALTVTDQVIIPTIADVFAVQGIARVFQTIAQVKKKANPSLKVSGILITRFNSRANISRQIQEIIEDAAQKLKTKVFNTYIRECSAIREAQAYKTNIYTFAPKSNAVIDYQAFIKELLKE